MKPVAVATAVLLCACNSMTDSVQLLEKEETEFLDNEGTLSASSTRQQTRSLLVETIDVSDIMRRRSQLSASEHRDRLWDLDHLPQDDAEATALLRIWTSEVEMSNELDLIGIWQVVQTVRWRVCDNTRFSRHVTKRITQCRTESGELVEPDFDETVEGAEETYLSAMRRLSERALGAVPARSSRGRWIREMTLDCERPESWNRSESQWTHVLQRRCEEYAPLARALIDGTEERRLSRAPLIAWGGRCERHCDDPADPSTCRQTGACDDRLACRRGLARIQSETANAFWCRPGSRGCPSAIDPLCEVFGIRIEDRAEEENSVTTDLTRMAASS